MKRLRAAWVAPGARRVGGDAAVEDFAVGDVDEEQQVVAAQQGCVDGREVTGNCCLGTQELGPGQARAPRGGVDAVLFEDSPHGGGSNAVTEADEFSGDSAVAPGGVVVGHFKDEATKRAGGGWPARRSRGLGPVSGSSPSVPAQQGLWCDEPAGSLRSAQGRRDGAEQGPVLVGEGWPGVLPVQDCQLVAQDDDLEVLRASRAHSQPCQQREEPWWSWGESNSRPSGGCRACYDHSRVCGLRLPLRRVVRITRIRPPDLSPVSAVFAGCQQVSPRRPPLLLLPGCSGLAPRAIAGRDDSRS